MYNPSHAEVCIPSIMSEPPLSILYVDDEPLLLKASQIFLESFGFIVDIADSGVQALEKLSTSTYDAIVSDYQMPKMDGIELLKEIRRRPLDIPFILFTGRGREEVVIEAIENGADFYLQKGGKPAPQFTELTHKIRVAVQQRRDRKARSQNDLRFRSLIQNSSDIIRILDKDGIILFESPSSSTILGYPEGSLIGSKAFDYIYPEDQERVTRDFLDVWNQCNSHTPTEYRIRKADGTYLYVESIALNLNGVPGVDGIVTTTHPIHNLKLSELKNKKLAEDLSTAYEELQSSEEELRENYIELAHHEQALALSEERFRGMAERSSDLIIILDKEMSPTYVSPSARSITGYDPTEFIGKSPDFASSTIFSQSVVEFSKAFQKAMRGEIVNNLEIRIIKKDGAAACVNLNAVPTIHEGVVTGTQVSMRDITSTKNAEQALRETEERFTRFATNAQDMLYRMSLPDGRFEYISPASVVHTGYTPEEFYSDPDLFKKLIHPVWQENFRKRWKAILEKNAPTQYEYQIVDRSGETRWHNQRYVQVTDEHGQPVALEGIITDVTQKKTIEQTLRKSEQRLLATTLNAGSWVWEVDSEGMYTYSSPAVEIILGYRPDELVGKVHFYDLFDPTIRDELKVVAMTAFSSHEPFCNFINLNRHKKGSLIILKTSGTPVFDEKGSFSGYYGVDEDITIEKEAEKKLIESEEKYRLLADNVHDVIWTADAKLQLTYISPSVFRLFGFGIQEAMAMSFHDLLTSESYQIFVQSHMQWMDILHNGGSIPEKTVIELEFRCKSGSTVWTEQIISPVFDTKMNFSGVVGVTRDISTRRKAEDALRKANRQLSLLSGITRHDVLNRISVIYSYLELLEKKLEDPLLHEYLREMISATEEIQSQIEFTRVYEELGSHEPHWVPLDTVMPRASLSDSITLAADVMDICIYADPVLQKVFFALLDNSIRHGERVSEIWVSTRESDNHLTIIWEDNGVGIPVEEKEPVFEHGFGKNTGLGLFMVREILSLTDISIQETGDEGKGARFEIVVPKGAYKRSNSD